MAGETHLCLAMVIVFALAMGGSLLPGLKHLQQFEHPGNAFAGGVLLAAGLVHMLPDANRDLQVFGSSIEHFFGGIDDGFPLASVVAGIGFLIMACLDCIATFRIDSAAVRGQMHDLSMQEWQVHDLHVQRQPSFVDTPNASTWVTSLSMLVSLTVHSILEGMGIGLSVGSTFYTLFLAVSLHKGFAAFALGKALRRNWSNTRSIFLGSIIFSAASPLGMLVGAVAGNDGSGAFAGICKALAAGTFFYVSVLELLQPSWTVSVGQFFNLSLSLASFLVFSILAVWT